MDNCSSEIKEFVYYLKSKLVEIINEEGIGFYLHGSLSMGGFNPNCSDVDVVVVLKNTLTVQQKRKLAEFFLIHSNSPFPIEIHFLNKRYLENWQHPCPFDFHYSEFWRERFEHDLSNRTYDYLNSRINTDIDLAAHLTIIKHKGICVEGIPINEIFPVIPQSDYLSAILADYYDCIDNIHQDPVYGTLNSIRVFWYLKEGIISSKHEAGNWGALTFPKPMKVTVKKALDCYVNRSNPSEFEEEELSVFRNYISGKIKSLM